MFIHSSPALKIHGSFLWSAGTAQRLYELPEVLQKVLLHLNCDKCTTNAVKLRPYRKNLRPKSKFRGFTEFS